MRGQPLAILVLIASMAGFGFAAVSTYDSVAHLDRQVHGIHCSYFLGAGKEDATGSSGCYATLMSPYSSIFRHSVWGGVPVALSGMSVFAFLVFWTLWMMVRRRLGDPLAAGFLFAATGIPTLTSIIMGYISVSELDTVCKMCVGIYTGSGVAFLAAGALFYTAFKYRSYAVGTDESESPSWVSWGTLFGAFGLGVAFVAAPVAAYAALAPDFSHYAGSCGNLTHPEDSEQVLIPVGPQNREIEMVEVIDPLCVACGLFERRFSAMKEARQVRRKIMLFPLDNTCNWMVDDAIHPGACTVSEAMICAGDRVGEVLDWVIDHQTEILVTAEKNPDAVKRMITSIYPELSSCIGSAAAKAKLNLSLRWAVKNQLQVLTPQIFVQSRRLCDEDTDLGLEYALTRLIARGRTGPPVPVVAPKEDPLNRQVPQPPRRRPVKKERLQPEPSPQVGEGPEPQKPAVPEEKPEQADSEASPVPEEGKPAAEPAPEEAPAVAPQKAPAPAPPKEAPAPVQPPPQASPPEAKPEPPVAPVAPTPKPLPSKPGMEPAPAEPKETP